MSFAFRILGVLLLATRLMPAQTQDAALLGRAAWLAGSWRGVAHGAVIEEQWMLPAGGVMPGMSRGVAADGASWEALRIDVDAGALRYIASPSGQRETAFRCTEARDGLLVFENAAHDYPQRIVYRRIGADALEARIELRDGSRRVTFPMHRVPWAADGRGDGGRPLCCGGRTVLFDDEVDAYRAADLRDAPDTDGVLCVGSSIMRLWDGLPAQMAPVAVRNRGIGGSRTWDQLYHFDRLVLPYRPSVVVYYCGSNDINDGEAAGAIVARTLAFRARLETDLPGAVFVYLSVIAAPQKRARWSVVDSVNQSLRAAADGRGMQFVDLNPALRGSDGTPRDDCFEADGLHLRPAGYEACARVLKPVLLRLRDLR